MSTPRPRWGVRYTDNISKNKAYIQNLYDNDSTAAKRGELFLNEVSEEIFYVGLDGVCRGLNETTPVSFSRIDFTGVREFADDAAAAVADPAVDIGGLYRTGSVLKIRVA